MNQEYLSRDIKSITNRNYVTLNEDNTVSQGVKIMRDSYTSRL